MKKKVVLSLALLMSVAASPVFAAHDHGSPGPVGPSASQAPKDDQNAKENEMLINNCAQYIGRIHQRIQTLQMEMKGKNGSALVRDELKKIEQNLKEANEIARSLQIM